MSAAPGTDNAIYRWATWLLFGGAGVLAMATFADYGLSWDEWFRWRGGQEKLEYYRALLAGVPIAEAIPQTDLYPGLFDLSLALLNEIVPLGLLVLGHLMSLLSGFLCLAGVWALGRKLGGARLAFFAALVLLLMPRFYGHMFFNPKDIPFAAGMTWSLYFLLCWGDHLRRPRWRDSALLGVLIGLTMGLRVGGMVLFGYVGLLALLTLGQRLRLEGRGGLRPILTDALRLLPHGALMAFAALAAVYPWWPYLHDDPLPKLLHAVSAISAYPWSGAIEYMGQIFPATERPWHYPFVWLAVTLPDFVYAILLVAGAIAALRLRTARLAAQADLRWVMVAFAFGFPLLYVVVRDSTLYDGIRHLLFVLPPLALILAALATRSFDFLVARRRAYGFAFLLLLAAAVLPQLVTLRQIHPYQYTYFNWISGGLPAADQRFDLEYWGTSMREASLWLEANTDPDASYRVASSLPFWLASMFLSDRFEVVRRDEAPHFYLSLTRLRLDALMEGEVLYEVKRQGAVFAVVKRVGDR